MGISRRVRLAIWRFRDGRVEEVWSIQDQFSLLQQVGLISPEYGGAQVPPSSSAHAG
jgi:hypothetical protein